MSTKQVYGYMCEIDWDHELGESLGGSRVYPSLADLKHNHTMWKECGIVKVKVSKVKSIKTKLKDK